MFHKSVYFWSTIQIFIFNPKMAQQWLCHIFKSGIVFGIIIDCPFEKPYLGMASEKLLYDHILKNQNTIRPDMDVIL